MKELKSGIRDSFDEKMADKIVNEMQKPVLR